MEGELRARLAAHRVLALLTPEERAAASVPVDVVAERLGLDLARFDAAAQPAGTLGFLEPGEEMIFVQAGLNNATRRFTLAHEIGHAVLHRRWGHAAERAGTALPGETARPREGLSACAVEDVSSEITTALSEETLLPGAAYSARARREREANAFAASLLMPEAQVRAYYAAAAARRRARRATDGPSASGLARRFGVSEDVALRRLTGLLVEPLASALAEEPPSPEARAVPLDAEQRAAATASAPALVLAGPGTGKTHTLAGRVQHLVREQHVPAEAVLALTFSTRAARSLRQRLAEALRDGAEAPLAEPALPTVSTIHAFCGDLLRQFGTRVGVRADYRLVTEVESYMLLRQVSGRLALEHYQPLLAPSYYLPDLLQGIARAKDELAGPEEYLAAAQAICDGDAAHQEAGERALEVARVYAAYQQVLTERGDPDFGDIVRLAVHLLQRHPDVLATVRARYQHVLVDEFQDINVAMGVLLHTLAGPQGPLWAVGDADQAIYRFRGAAPANLARFTADYPSAGVHLLTHNYRSTPPILAAADALAQATLGGPERAPRVAARSVRQPAPVLLARAADEDAELTSLAADLVARHAEGREWTEFAVLCRTRRQVQRVAATLRAEGIPVRVNAPVLAQPEVKHVLAVLSLLAEGSGAGLLRAGALAAHPFTREEAHVLLREARARQTPPLLLLTRLPDDVAGISAEGRAGMARLGEILSALRRAPDVATGLARYVFTLTGLGDDLLAPEAAARAAHIARLLGLARAFEDARILPAAAPKAFHRRRAAWAEFLDYARVLLAVRQEPAGDDPLPGDGVHVLTVHGSKGLEFPVVFLPGLAERRFPAPARPHAVDVPEALHTQRAPGEDAEAEQRHEEACLFYVALTRARDQLVLTCAGRYGRRPARLSPFVVALEERLGTALAQATWLGGERRPLAHDAHAAPDATVDHMTAEQGLTPAAIETYARCPRQFAYRYVYGLPTHERELAAMRQAVAQTLQAVRAALTDQAPSMTREEARQAFVAAWQAQVGTADAAAGTTGGGPFAAVYLRAGERMVEHAWQKLNAQPEAAAHQFEQTLPVRIGAHEIAVTVDRVDAGAEPQSAPRLVRQWLGRGRASPDLRTFLYTLAAERGSTPAAEVVHEQVATGEQQPVRLSERQRERLAGTLQNALEGIERAEYPPHPESHTCQSCPFLLICPA